MNLYVEYPGVEVCDAGLFDVCAWVVQTYPEDIFVKKPRQIIKLRDCAKRVLKMRKQK